MDLHLKDQVALVTGGSRGLGAAICLKLAAEGAVVAVNYRRGAEAAAAMVEQIQDTFGTRALALPGDVGSEADVDRMFQQIDAELGPIDILVNNASVCPTAWVQDLTLEQWNETLQVNLTGTFLTCRWMVKQLREQQRTGRIVNISSMAAFLGSTTGHAPYDASKGAIVSFTVSLARETAPHGIAVNAVAPGMMYTDMTAAAIDANKEKYLARIPLGRIGDPAEVADIVAFLASDRASYMTGATVDVSGGMLMR
jgi:3-oxoacyl-[acyl-carrier protein] reductase